jgi:hypothetical protein
MEIEIKNAVIKSAEITNDDHGLLTAWLTLDYGGSGQGFGGYSLYLPKSFTHHSMNINYAGHFIWRVMEIAGVNKWSQLTGKTVRVKQEHSGVHAIGHIVKDDWFNPQEDFAKVRYKPEIEKICQSTDGYFTAVHLGRQWVCTDEKCAVHSGKSR